MVNVPRVSMTWATRYALSRRLTDQTAPLSCLTPEDIEDVKYS